MSDPVNVITNGDSVRCSHCRVIADAEHIYVDPDCPIHALPSTPTAVKVSDRMRELIKDMGEYIGQVVGIADYRLAWRDGMSPELMRGLEDQRARGRALLARVKSSHPDPASSGFDPGTYAKLGIPWHLVPSQPCLPQTLGEEEIPEYVTAAIARLRQMKEDWRLAGKGFGSALIWLAESRSRLLTALEEKEKEQRDAQRYRYLRDREYYDLSISVAVQRKTDKSYPCGDDLDAVMDKLMYTGPRT